MRILSFSATISSSISRMTEKAFEMLSPEKKIGIIASAVFVTFLVAFCLYRLICFKGRRLEKAAEKQSLGQAAEKLRKDCKFEEATKIFQEALKQNPLDIFSLQKNSA